MTPNPFSALLRQGRGQVPMDTASTSGSVERDAPSVRMDDTASSSSSIGGPDLASGAGRSCRTGHRLPGGWVRSLAKHWPALHTWVLDFCKDKYQSPSGLTAAAITATVQSLTCQQHNDVIRQEDVWGSMHGHKAALALDAFTYLSRDASYNVVAARLDYIMAPTHMLSACWAGSCSHRRDVQPSDHAAVELCWRPPQCTPKGRARWTLPDYLLRDADFLTSAADAATVFSEGWQAEREGSGWEARDKYEAVKEHIVQLAVARLTTLTAQRRAAVRAAKQVEGAACLRQAGPAAGWSGCCRACAQWKAALYALHDAGGHAVATAKGGSPCGFAVGGRWGTEHQVFSQAWPPEPSCACGHDLCEGVRALRGPSGAFRA
jgi:hypothetical protein